MGKSVASMTNEEIISNLKFIESPSVGFCPTAWWDSFIPIDEKPRFSGGVIGKDYGFISPLYVELVKRGVSALPIVIENLSNSTPTQFSIPAYSFFTWKEIRCEYYSKDSHSCERSFQNPVKLMTIVLSEKMWFPGHRRNAYDQKKAVHFRRIMGKTCPPFTSGQTWEEGWSTTTRKPGGVGGDSLGSQNWCSMDRSTTKISQSFNLLETIGEMGRNGHLAQDLASLPRCLGRKREIGVERVFRGWEFLTREKRGLCVGPTKKGKGTKWMVATDGKGIPVALHLESASRAEIKLLETTLEKVRVPKVGPGRPKSKPQRVIADRGYDSDPHRKRFLARGIELIVPYRKNSQKRFFEDGRKLRRYRKRFKVERTISWFGNFRRLLNRFEHKITSYTAFFHIACIMIVARWF